MIRLIICLLCLFSSAALAITKQEQTISSIVEADEKNAVALLEKIVNINSGTMNFEGVRKVGDIFAEAYRQLGFDVTWIDGKEFGRAGHLLATYANNEHLPKLLLIGHLDTVFSKNSPLQKFTKLANNKVSGPGITDMKGGDVVMLYALKALKDAGVLDELNIKIILTGDEEKRGRPLSIATQVLIEAGIWADVAIGFEDGDGNPKTAVTARRGSSGWLLDVTGKANHSSQIFREGYGYGAIFETARILNAFREQLISETNLTFNPGLILGGTEANLDSALARGEAYGKNNVIPKTTHVSGGIRAISPEQLSRSQKVMLEIVSNNLDETSAKLTLLEGYPPMAPSTGNTRLLNIYNQISLDLGYGEVRAVDPRKAGAADISFVAEHVDMAIDGLGLMGSGGHTENEVADMLTLRQQTIRAALLMYRLGHIKK